jgi:hypothetical protein
MNETLQNTLAQALMSLIETATEAKDFLVAETPDVVYQLLLWHSVISGIACAIMLIVGLVGIAAARRLAEFEKEASGNAAGTWAICAICAAVWGAIFLNCFDWLQIWIAPKLYLVEYAGDLVKK